MQGKAACVKRKELEWEDWGYSTKASIPACLYNMQQKTTCVKRKELEWEDWGYSTKASIPACFSIRMISSSPPSTFLYICTTKGNYIISAWEHPNLSWKGFSWQKSFINMHWYHMEHQLLHIYNQYSLSMCMGLSWWAFLSSLSSVQTFHKPLYECSSVDVLFIHRLNL